MPITPLHFGLGLAAKSAVGRFFSLPAFIAANCLMDVEPVVRVVLGLEGGLHEATHTMEVGAVIAVAATVLTRQLLPASSTWLTAGLGSAYGIATHLVLDALYHADVADSLGLPGASNIIPHAYLDGWLLLMLIVFCPPYYATARAWVLQQLRGR